MIPYDPGKIGRGHCCHIRLGTVGMELPRASKCRLEEAEIAQARRAAVQRNKPAVERENLALVDPKRFSHFASWCRVLR